MEKQNKPAGKSGGSKAASDAAALARAAAMAEAARNAAAAQNSASAQNSGMVRSGQSAQNADTVQSGSSTRGANQQNDATAAAAVTAGQSGCGVNCGTLPGVCAPLAFPYVPVQDASPVRYSRMEALETGTLFPGLNLPFKAAIQAHTKLNNTALVELMALDFALQELGLYLNTHPGDQEVLQLFWSYAQLAKEGRERYQEQYGPLVQSDLTPEQGYAWLKDPWPWDVGGNR